MTKQQAKDILKQYDAYLDSRNVQAHFKSTNLGHWDSELQHKYEEAKIVLGKSQWQRSYKQLLIDHPTMPLCYYMKKRILR